MVDIINIMNLHLNATIQLNPLTPSAIETMSIENKF